MKKALDRGFTLIELLVVIAIISLLASIVLASLNSARQKARNARRVADLKQISTALELYFDSSNAYPNSSGGAWRSECNSGKYLAFQQCHTGSCPCVHELIPV